MALVTRTAAARTAPSTGRAPQAEQGGGTNTNEAPGASLHLLGSACSGTCRVAEAGLLDGHCASQVPYSASAMVQSQGHALIERARSWLNKRLDQPWAVPEMAAYCHTNQRSSGRLRLPQRSARELARAGAMQQIGPPRRAGLLAPALEKRPQLVVELAHCRRRQAQAQPQLGDVGPSLGVDQAKAWTAFVVEQSAHGTAAAVERSAQFARQPLAGQGLAPAGGNEIAAGRRPVQR